MAIAIGKVNLDSADHVVGNHREKIVDVTLDSSYPTGGYTLTQAQLGIDWKPYFILAVPTTTGHDAVYNYSTGKLMMFSGGTQVTNATDLSAVVLRVIAKGKGSPVF